MTTSYGREGRCDRAKRYTSTARRKSLGSSIAVDAIEPVRKEAAMNNVSKSGSQRRLTDTYVGSHASVCGDGLEREDTADAAGITIEIGALVS